jgi:hypothetical protein
MGDAAAVGVLVDDYGNREDGDKQNQQSLHGLERWTGQ